jgi:histidinol-phosphatase (PHP family)
MFDEKIHQILKLLIERGIAYEVNTSIYGGTYSAVMQEIPYLEKYFEMGGRLITIGADSHTPENVGLDFERIIKILKDIGFTKAYYYQNRKAVAYDL